MAENLTLIRLAIEHRPLLLSMLEDYQTAGEQFLSQPLLEQLQTDFAALVQQLQSEEADRNLPDGKVPQSTLWLMRNSAELLGRVNLRHRLTPALEHHGGHIGYCIRPSRRGQGYGTKMLALALDEARRLGLSKILMTCDVDNLALARGIEKNGGVLVSQGVSDVSGQLIARYWIAL
ncbi:GNAT family N-acetyltransferase [Nodosilinea sp. LEGE 07088]|uniref:GNAT family N-acetyltransferase n=1 Tax=Nodosilinea sp. LEGE 07088 TaxID=2777968 RepID=UPI0018824ACA|nr:GNAT family N-acetyltransferase [Nodosilinea sp. LEGE 07088]MBE9136957.1 GNAT family N-acetyltransferase [Nodosilinea sp. LEGE 07088]